MINRPPAISTQFTGASSGRPSPTAAGRSSATSSPRSVRGSGATITQRMDSFSQRKQALALFVKYINSLYTKLAPEDSDEYIVELKDALTKIGLPPGPTMWTAEERAFCDYFKDIEGHDPAKLSSHMEDIASLILHNPSATERETMRDRLVNGFTHLKTAVERKAIAEKLDTESASDAAKYRSLVQLFDINYFSSNTFYEMAGASTESRLNTVAKKVNDMRQKERKELAEKRQKELTRARTAKLYFNKLREEGAAASPRNSSLRSPANSVHI